MEKILKCYEGIFIPGIGTPLFIVAVGSAYSIYESNHRFSVERHCYIPELNQVVVTEKETYAFDPYSTEQQIPSFEELSEINQCILLREFQTYLYQEKKRTPPMKLREIKNLQIALAYLGVTPDMANTLQEKCSAKSLVATLKQYKYDPFLTISKDK